MSEVRKRLSQDPERLFRARVLARLTQPQLAEQAGLSKGTISKLESGDCSAQPDTLHRIAEVLGVEVEALMPPVDEPRPGTSATERTAMGEVPVNASLDEARSA